MASAIGAWSGDNTTEDSIGTADGFWNGTPSYGPGLVGAAAFAFQGAQFVKAPAFDYTGAFSLSFWAKANAVQSANTGLVASAETNLDLAKTFQVDWGSFGRYRLRAGTATAPLSLDIGAASTTAFQHIVVTYDGATEVRTYLDGEPVATGTWTGEPLLFTAMKIGVNRGQSYRYNGTIDDVYVFSRALSANEVRAVFHGQGAGICP
ncbi:MAG TPA: LamG domain-containing protein [Kofleriaceae bacterium]|nr:LamG domain-containing protein [Kofleriaceae bacterium]